MELLSPSTAERDKTVKKAIYRDRLRCAGVFWFEPLGGSWRGSC
ncbi:MAG: hypothetical protein AB4040_02280 [Synechococcus sp.]